MILNHNHGYNKKIREWLFNVFKFASEISKTDLESKDCPVCGSTKNSFYANNDYLDYVKCHSCELLYMNPAPAAMTIDQGFQGGDKLLDDYFSIMQQYKKEIPEKNNPKEDNKIKDIYLFKKSGRLLDIGCSVGDFLHKAKYWYDVEGLEINPQTSKIAKQYFNVHQNFLSDLNLNNCYDIVTMHQLLYGIPDPVGLLKDIYKIMNDDGILYINSPNADSYAMQVFKGKTNHLYGYTSLNVFNKKSLQMLCKLSGFEIVSFRTEWMDVYLTDIQEFSDHPNKFIHKRNTHLKKYEENIRLEDELQSSLHMELADKGNYFVAVLKKILIETY